MIIQIKKKSGKKLSKNFNSDEFDCRCKSKDCKTTLIDTDLVSSLESLREEVDGPIEIISGYRCAAKNQRIGGKRGSYHLIGKAADIAAPSVTIAELHKMILNYFDGTGTGKTKTHVDVRGYKASWVYK